MPPQSTESRLARTREHSDWTSKPGQACVSCALHTVFQFPSRRCTPNHRPTVHPNSVPHHAIKTTLEATKDTFTNDASYTRDKCTQRPLKQYPPRCPTHAQPCPPIALCSTNNTLRLNSFTLVTHFQPFQNEKAAQQTSKSVYGSVETQNSQCHEQWHELRHGSSIWHAGERVLQTSLTRPDTPRS